MLKSRAVDIGLRNVLLIVLVFFPGLVLGTDGKPAPRGVAEDHPLGLVAFASLDRLLARAASVGEAAAYENSEKLLFAFLGNDESVVKFCNSPGLDTTRPFGAMSYPNWFATANVPEAEGAPEDSDGAESPAEAATTTESPVSPEIGLESLTDPEALLGTLAAMFVENATLVICLPVKDQDQLMSSLRELLQKDGTELTAVESQPGWYQIDNEAGARVGFVGTYFMVVAHDSKVHNFDRHYPDFGRLARTSLGKNGFVYSLYRKGLPEFVRDGLAPMFKLAYAAQFQQRDDESELSFRLRTMFASVQLELMDLVVSHVDEFRITGHVDSSTHTIHVEPELVGPKDGKFARFCNGIVGKRNPFAHLTTDDAIFAATTSFPLPQKAWKPLADALYRQAQSIAHADTAAVVRVIAQTIDSGQIDLYTSNPTWNDGLFAVKVAGGAEFPEQLQQMIAAQSNPPLFELAVDSIEGFPVHRTLTTIDSPQETLLLLLMSGLLWQDPDLPGLNQPAVETEIIINSVRDVVQPDGTKRIVPQTTKGIVPGAKNAVWLVATPQSIWLAVGPAHDATCPEWFKSQVVASLARPNGSPATGRSKSPVQLMVRGIGASAPVNAIQQAGTKDSPVKAKSPADEKAEQRGDLLRDLPNTVRFEVRPNDTGMKFALSFEEGYFRWFGEYVKHSIEENEEAAKKRAPVPPVIESPAK